MLHSSSPFLDDVALPKSDKFVPNYSNFGQTFVKAVAWCRVMAANGKIRGAKNIDLIS
jgi:hypothetical protein